MAGIFGVDIDFNAYTESFKQYAADGIAYLTEYKQYFTEQATVFANWINAQSALFFAWIKESIQTGMEFATWAATSAWQYIRNMLNGENLRYVLNLIWRGFVAGYEATIDLGFWLARNLRNLFFHAIEFIANIPDYLMRCWNSFVWLLTQGYNLGYWLVTTAFEFAKSFANTIWNGLCRLGTQLWNQLGLLYQAICNFVTNIPTYLTRFFQNIVREFTEFLVQLQNVLSVLYDSAKIWMQRALRVIGIGVGVLWGISAGIVELSGTFINHILEQTLGLSLTPLTTYAAFGYLQTGLSLALFGFFTYQICRLSYLGVAGFIALANAPRAINALNGNDAEPVAPGVQPEIAQQFEPEAAPALEAAPVAILNQFPQPAAAEAVNDALLPPQPDVVAENRATM